MSAGLLVGVFVGGRSMRMGGRPKGLLAAPDTGEPLVVRAVRVAREAGAEAVLVGDAAPYRDVVVEVARLADDPAGVGPLGGLSALLAYAGERRVIALACDMPYVSVGDLRALADSVADEAVVAARRGDEAPWEPLLARYDAPRALAAVRAALSAGERSLQGALARAGVAKAVGLGARAADDWDTPGDVG